MINAVQAVLKRSEVKIGSSTYYNLRSVIKVGEEMVGIRFMNSSASMEETYVVNQIFHNGKVIWKYENAKDFVPDFKGRILLDELNGAPVLIWDSWGVVKVVPISHILNSTQPTEKEQVALQKAVCKKWGWVAKSPEKENGLLD